MKTISFDRSGVIAALVIAVAAASACQGTVLDSSGSESGSDGPGSLPSSNSTSLDRSAECSVTTINGSPVRRLSHVEYNRTIQDLFPEGSVSWEELPPDEHVHGFENNSRALNPSPVLVEERNKAAMRIAERVVNRGKAKSAVLGCDPSGDEAGCGRQFITNFGMRAFRRALTTEEVDLFHGFFVEKMGAIDFDAALELTLQAFLQSPHFLYRLEFGVPAESDKAASIPLSDYELASRLSYGLWQTMPDEELLQAAATGELSSSDGYNAQVERMLDSERTAKTFGDFHRQWLESDEVLEQRKERKQFPAWSNSVKDAMHEEASRFPELLYVEGNATLEHLLTSTRTEVDKHLAEVYGVPAPEEGWHAVDLPKEERAGLLTRGAFLAAHARPTNGSPPLRGVAVMEKILCAEPDPPPPDVDTSLPEQDKDAPKTNRQLFESRTAVAPCNGCHQRIDGIGMAFENYDAMGQWRSEDNGMPVDASGELLDTDVDAQYEDAVGLSKALASSKQVETCMTINWYRYTHGRDEQPEDWCKIDEVQTALQEADGDLKALLRALVTSHEFTHRTVIE